MDSQAHMMASMEEANIDGQNENKKSRALLQQPEHESAEVKYMVMACDAFLHYFLAFSWENTLS